MITELISHFAADAACSTGSFFGLPTWYAYLPQKAYPDCSPQIQSLSDVWLIVAAIVEILLRLAALAAIVMVIYGGVEFISSQGNPDKAHQARGTIINSLIGLVIAVVAAATVTFIAGRFTS